MYIHSTNIVYQACAIIVLISEGRKMKTNTIPSFKEIAVQMCDNHN